MKKRFILIGLILLVGLVGLLFANTVLAPVLPDNIKQVIEKNLDDKKNLGGTLTPKDLVERRNDFLGKKVSVKGKLLFYLDCPPTQYPQYPQGGCVLIGYLVEKKVNYVFYDELDQNLRLFENNYFVGCAYKPAQTKNCDGWVHSKIYLVEGTLRYLTLNGKTLDTLILEVESREEL